MLGGHWDGHSVADWRMLLQLSENATKKSSPQPPSVGGARSKVEPNCSPHSGGRENVLTWRVFNRDTIKMDEG